MSALTADRQTLRKPGENYDYPVAAGVKIYAGALVVLNATGYAKPGVTGTGLVAVGRAEMYVDNTNGNDGDVRVSVRIGVYHWANSSAENAITIAEIGDVCYVVDDQTVAKTNGSGTRSPAGIVDDVDATGVWVRMGYQALTAPAGALVATANLSDVANAATARGNLGLGSVIMGDPVPGTVGAETANTINVPIQLKDPAGANLAVRGSVFAYLATTALGAALTGLTIASVAIGTNGLMLDVGDSNKSFRLVSDASGQVDVTIGCTGTGTCYLILVEPTGKLVASAAITFT
jgi:hypothetical protein